MKWVKQFNHAEFPVQGPVYSVDLYNKDSVLPCI